jgi:molecular chaperone GrpE
VTIKHTDAEDHTAGDGPAAPENDPPTPGDSALSELSRERDDLKDRLLRTAAEFDNFRKRTERERRDVREAASADLVRDLLPVVDDLERALEAVEASAGAVEESGEDATPLEGFRDGVELIRRQLLDVLRRRGVEPLDVVDQPFDPNWHEAVAYEPAAGRPDGEIIGEVRRGYRLGDRLLRPAMVRVAKA